MQEQALDFTVSSGLKNIIGRDLITEDRIAIFELVKNSYDADASQVIIDFENVRNQTPEKESKIYIIDNGSGMSSEDITGKWLFVAYSEKKIIDLPEADYRDKIAKRKRIFAGAKGIGRFSADRLGSKLTIFTRKKGEKTFHKLAIDWAEFDKNQKDNFLKIPTLYSEVEELPIRNRFVRGFEKGTVLEISQLNDEWDRKKLLTLKSYLQRLINPSQRLEKDKFNILLFADEFVAEDKKAKEPYEKINGPIRNAVFEKIDKKTTKIECEIGEKGDVIVTSLTDKGRFVFKFTEKNPYHSLHDIRITVYYLNPSAKTEFTRIMGLEPKNYGSIFLYKNGFRIHPYGDEKNDWLGLDRRKTQGWSRNLGNREVIGTIEVLGIQTGFSEVSSRDGGVANSVELEQLKGENALFMEKVFKRLEAYVVQAIRWDSENPRLQKTPEQIDVASIKLIENVIGSSKDEQKNIILNRELLDILKERQIEGIPEVIKNLEHIMEYVTERDERAYIRTQLSAVRNAVRAISAEKTRAEEELEAKKKEALFFQKAASADVVSLQNMNHEIGEHTSRIRKNITLIERSLKKGESPSRLTEMLDNISEENDAIRVLAGIVSVANFNLSQKEIRGDLVAYISEYISRILGTKRETMEPVLQGTEISFVTRFRPIEISIVLDNMISNSRKAYATRMTFRFEQRPRRLVFLVGDNGNGIRKENQRFLFTRGFTTTTGSGIGLHLMKRTIESNGGTIRFLGNNVSKMGKGACFEVVIP